MLLVTGRQSLPLRGSLWYHTCSPQQQPFIGHHRACGDRAQCRRTLPHPSEIFPFSSLDLTPRGEGPPQLPPLEAVLQSLLPGSSACHVPSFPGASLPAPCCSTSSSPFTVLGRYFKLFYRRTSWPSTSCHLVGCIHHLIISETK